MKTRFILKKKFLHKKLFFQASEYLGVLSKKWVLVKQNFGPREVSLKILARKILGPTARWRYLR
jgi:hypothetical protein